MKVDLNLKNHIRGQAVQLLGNGRLVEAKSLFKQLCELDAADAEAWHTLGIVSGQLGHIDEAEAACRRAIAINPAFAQAHCDLGNALFYKGRLDEAVSSYREALRLAPDNTVALNNLGNVLSDLQRLDEAAAIYEEALRLRPSAMTFYNYGNVLLRQQRLDVAAAKFREALRLQPDFAEAYNNLGIAYRHMAYHDKAASSFKRAVDIRQDYADPYANLGTVLMELGRLDEALDCYRRALSIDPGNVKAAVGEARIYAAQGDFDRAYSRLKPLLEADKETSVVALAFAALCRRIGRCDDAVAMMERLLERTAPSPDVYERISLHFELGRVLDASAEYDRAFAHYRKGNELKAHPFDPEQYARYIDGIISTYNAEFMARAPRAANASQRPVFIVGVPRSGTSLVEQILASHPQVYGAGELEEITRIDASLMARFGTDAPSPQYETVLTQETCDALSLRYLDRLAEISHDAPRVTDKMPANYLHLGLINLLFPKARVIHCVRDPLDTCLSCYFQQFSASNFYAYDLRHLGAYYRQYQRLMRHWEGVLDIAVMKVSYEELVADLEGVSRAMLEFCGLAWDERCLHFYDTKRVVATASQDQVRQPLYRQSVGRWKNYESYLGPLKEALAGR